MKIIFIKYVFFLSCFILSLITRAGAYETRSTITFHNHYNKNIGVEIKLFDLNGEIKRTNEYRISLKTYQISIAQVEPFKAEIMVYQDKTAHRFSYWIYNDRIDLYVDSTTTSLKIGQSITGQGFAEIDQQIVKLDKITNNLVKGIPYKDYPGENFTKRIDFIKDSIAVNIDQAYKDYFEQNPNTFNGLYAFLQYAYRPLDRTRINHDPFQIDSLLNRSFGKLESESIVQMKKVISRSKNLVPGKAFPPLIFADSTGKNIPVTGFKGKVVLIDLWATWCGYCRLEHPHLIKIYNKYKAENFQIIGVSVDELKVKYLWQEAIVADKIDIWPQYLANYNELKEKLNLRAIPANFILDSNGKIIEKNLMEKNLDAKLKELFGY